MSIKSIDHHANIFTGIGWICGLSYYNWFAEAPRHVPLWVHLLLIVAGIFFVTTFIVTFMVGLAAIFALRFASTRKGHIDLFAVATVVSPAVAFFAAKYALQLFS